jgi:DNA-binding LacI/PurR family transcriptional regulator
MSVPGDFSVVGFDDIEMSGYFSPPLTTVRQDRDALGSSAARLLLGRLQETAGGAEGPIIVPVSLIKRASAGPPRAES